MKLISSKLAKSTFSYKNTKDKLGKLYYFLTVDWFRHIIEIAFFFSPPRKWPHEWQKHVCCYHVIKLHSYTQVHLLVF